MYEGSYKIDSRLFITHFLVLGGFKEFRTYFLYIFAKKTSEKYFTKKILENAVEVNFSNVFIRMYFSSVFVEISNCILRAKKFGVWGQHEKGRHDVGIIIKGILMMLVFIIRTDVGIISICTDIMITDTPSFVLILI